MIPLPKTLQHIADIIGRRNALSLVSISYARGHRRSLYVPHNIDRTASGRRIRALIGQSAAADLSYHYGGEKLNLATCEDIRINWLCAEIVRMTLDGHCRRYIADVVGYTPMTVARYQRELRPLIESRGRSCG